MRYTAEVKYSKETDEYYLQFDPSVLAQMGWDFGDTILWTDNGNGSFTLTKKMDNESSDAKTNDQTDGAAKG